MAWFIYRDSDVFFVYGQNINAEKITVPDSKLTNLYQIDSGVYRSEQPSDADFKALEKYGIREVLNLATGIVTMMRRQEQRLSFIG